MTALFLTMIITCSQAVSVINRIEAKEGLPRQIKNEIIEEIQKSIPTCPVVVKKDTK